jgi:predicted ATPase/Tfp pilus assembly protein PilF
LTLIGPGGIGKTRLALQTAQEVQSQYPDGVFFIPLAALSSENFLVYTISNALQLSFYQRDDPKVLLLDYLRGKQMLLVLDNFEHLIAGGGLLAEVLAHAPEIKMMTTSRIRLGLRGEWIFEVKGLKFPQNGDYKGEQGFSAVELFLQTAQRVRPGFSPSRADLRHTIQICRLLEGMPLGIELAAAWVRMLPCQEIAQEIEQNLDFLTTSLQDLPERHQSLRAVFDHSWHLLAEEEQRVFKMLSVFRGGFQRIAAQLIAGASPNLLLGLMDKSLINHTTTGRYEMHELLRQYAVEHLAEKPTDKVTAHDLHSQYYATFLQERADDLRGGRQKQAVEEIVTEIENVRRGWRWAIEQWRTEEIVKYLDGLYIFFELRGWFREGEETFSLVEDELQKRRFKDQQADPEDKNIIAKQLARQGGFSINLGDYEKAGELLEDSMAEFRRQEAHGEIGFCLFNLGDLARRRGDYQAARHLLEESVSVLGTAGEPRKLARALNMLGIVTASVGGYAEATQLFRASIARLKELGDLWGVGKGLNNLGIVTYYFEQYQEAQDLYQESLQINREIGDDHGVAIALNNLGLVAHELGAYEDAQDLHNESLEIFSKTGYSLGAGNCLNDLGKASLALGDYEQAKDYLIRALRIAQEIQALPLGMSAITGIGFLHMEEGDYAGALALLVSVVEHPASDQDTKDRAEQLLPKLETQLTAEAISQAKRRGKALDYVKIMEEFLNPPQ